MRAYAPLAWEQVAEFHAERAIRPPVRACAVDQAWRQAATDVDEEQWEYEAQAMAAESLGEAGGLVLAVDVPEPAVPLADGWFELGEPVGRSQVAAILTGELAWFALQELPQLLDAP